MPREPLEAFNFCIITGRAVTDLIINNDIVSYWINLDGKDIEFVLCRGCWKVINEWLQKDRNKALTNALLLSGYRPSRGDEHYPFATHRTQLEKFIVENPYPKTPAEKLENLFLYIVNKQNFHGDTVHFPPEFPRPEFYEPLFFVDAKEYLFYFETLMNEGLIEKVQPPVPSNYPNRCSVSYKGLLRSIQLTEEGEKGNRVFVAMSFHPEENYIYDDAIFPILDELKYRPIRVDREHPDAEQTINDLIIAELKKSKFVIADFTRNREGVYFESGYGLAKGKKVIYTCHKDHLNKVHFDVNHFPVLVYGTAQELKKMLKAKIEAWIN